MATPTSLAPNDKLLRARYHRVVLASSLGTVFEWYDFYVYGILAALFSGLFFPAANPVAAYLSSLLTFGVGFVVRPFGAIVFGRIGDLAGRKYTFLITIFVMGVSTALLGFLPTYAEIGMAAPVTLFLLRVAQGLALGGEYGGASIYVAEHAPDDKRGLSTGWVQTTASGGLFLSFAVIMACRLSMPANAFRAWGWRIPFIASVALLGVSLYIRLKLQESPVFQAIKAQGRRSARPLRDSLRFPNRRYVLLALFGLINGQAVTFYTSQFYTLFFVQHWLGLKDFRSAYPVIGVAVLLGMPFFVFFGWLSDRIGRKWIMMTGCLLAGLTYLPLFQALPGFVNPGLAAAIRQSPITIHGDAADLEKVKLDLNTRGYPFKVVWPPGGDQTLGINIGQTALTGYNPDALGRALAAAGYPKVADPAKANVLGAIFVVVMLTVYAAMVGGPAAAFLVELFPANIRYTSLSLPYHIANGIFGGLLPLVSAFITVATGNLYAGLWYPIVVVLVTFVVGSLFLPETRENDIRL